MEDLNIKQLTLAVRTIAEEKNLPEETVLNVIEQAIAAAWRRDNGERDQDVRAELNVNDGTANVFVRREVVELVGSDVIEISLADAKKMAREAIELFCECAVDDKKIVIDELRKVIGVFPKSHIVNVA